MKIARAEPGGYNGNKLWRPARLGYRPTYETDAMKRFLRGDFIKAEK